MSECVQLYSKSKPPNMFRVQLGEWGSFLPTIYLMLGIYSCKFCHTLTRSQVCGSPHSLGAKERLESTQLLWILGLCRAQNLCHKSWVYEYLNVEEYSWKNWKYKEVRGISIVRCKPKLPCRFAKLGIPYLVEHCQFIHHIDKFGQI